jgi:hypothetical protein
MNLRTAQKELRSRPPYVDLQVLVVEGLVMVLLGILLASIFS